MSAVTIGQRIAAMREARKWTQAELGARVGTSGTYIGHLETGYRQPSYPTIKAIARALGVTLADLDPELTEQPESTDAPAVALAS